MCANPIKNQRCDSPVGIRWPEFNLSLIPSESLGEGARFQWALPSETLEVGAFVKDIVNISIASL